MAKASTAIFALTTDFGTADYYVAAVKAVLLRTHAAAQIVDVSHAIPPQDVTAGAITLERAIASFPPGTMHLAVVDPGVGSRRRILVVEIAGQRVICPDNGLITWALHRQGGGRCWQLTWRPESAGHTFHARDIMAPAAAQLVQGVDIKTLARRIDDPILLDLAPALPTERIGQIIHIDHYGNATTNFPQEILGMVSFSDVALGTRKIGPVRRSYGDVLPRQPLALVGSSNLVEIAVRDGSAEQMLKLKVGDEVRLI